MAFDAGYNYQVWQKSDHRAAAYLAADAARAAEWRLLYEGQIINDGLEAHLIDEYLFYGGNVADKNTRVDITDYADQRVEAGMKYISQWGSGWDNYRGSNLGDYPQADQDALKERITRRISVVDGRSYENFRYYKGIPDGIGHAPRH
jgi:LmbE family N-acetylglucosaminyl deacetylase